MVTPGAGQAGRHRGSQVLFQNPLKRHRERGHGLLHPPMGRTLPLSLSDARAVSKEAQRERRH